MSGALGLKLSMKSVASTTFKLSQRSQSIAALSVSSFDDKSRKVIINSYAPKEPHIRYLLQNSQAIIHLRVFFLQTPYHAVLFIAASIAAVVANASTSSCDAEANTNHKVKHQDLKNQDPVAWARDSSSKQNCIIAF